MKYLVITMFLLGCGAVSAQDHADNALDAAEYQAEALKCGFDHKGDCPGYLACKCVADKKYNFDSGACSGKYQDGSIC